MWACKACLIYEVGLGLILLTRLVYDDPHRRAARLYFTVARVSRSVAGKNGAKSNLFGLKATVRSCCLRRGIQGWWHQGWDEAPGPAPGDLQGRNMPAKTIFLNLIISHGRRWMQGQSRRYHSQHHHHPRLQMIPVRAGWESMRVLVYKRNQSQTHETSIFLARSIYQLFNLKETAYTFSLHGKGPFTPRTIITEITIMITISVSHQQMIVLCLF